MIMAYERVAVDEIAKGRAFDKSDPNSKGDLMPISVIRQDTPYSADVGY